MIKMYALDYYVFSNFNVLRIRPWQSYRITWCWWNWTFRRRQPALRSSTTPCSSSRAKSLPKSGWEQTRKTSNQTINLRGRSHSCEASFLEHLPARALQTAARMLGSCAHGTLLYSNLPLAKNTNIVRMTMHGCCLRLVSWWVSLKLQRIPRTVYRITVL